MKLKTTFLLYFIFIFFQFFAQSGSNVNLLFHWEDTSLVASTAHDNVYNEIWGVTVKGKEYAIIGTTAGTHIFDVTNPTNAYQAVFIKGAVQGSAIVHRDFHDYKGYLYIAADEGPSTLQIADLSYLPDSAPVVYDSNQLFSRAHNIFIDTLNAKLYQCGGDKNSGIRVFSLANPENPVEIASVPFPETTHDIYVRNDTAFINDGSQGLFIYDFSSTPPQMIGSLTSYTNQGYNHSGWLSDNGKVYALADETHGMKVKLVDVSNLSNISVLSVVGSEVFDQSLPHNILLKGDYMYISYYFDGLYIYNISDPKNPVLTGYYDTSTEIPNLNYRGAWGVYPHLPSGIVLVSDMQNGLFVFDVQDALSVKESSTINTLKIYPNPFASSFHITTKEKGLLTVYSELGQHVLSQQIKSGSSVIKIDEILSTGLYFVQFHTDSQLLTTKLIKH